MGGGGMTDDARAPAPTRQDERINTLDVLRGVAICGILLMNIPMMGMVGLAGRPLAPFAWSADWIAWSVVSVAFEGTMRGLFTILFGAGMLLMLRRAEGPAGEVTPIDVWTRRCLALMALGIVQFAVFMWPGEILWAYGMAGLALLAFRTARVRALLIAAAIVLAGTSAWKMHESYGQIETARTAAVAVARQARGAALSEEQEAALRTRAVMRRMLTPTPAEAREEVAQRTSFPGVLGWSTDLWVEWNLGTEAWPWLAETLGMMLIGMALFRAGILSGTASAGAYRLMTLGGYGGGLALRLFVYLLQLRSGFALDFDRPDVSALLWHEGLYELGPPAHHPRSCRADRVAVPDRGDRRCGTGPGARLHGAHRLLPAIDPDFGAVLWSRPVCHAWLCRVDGDCGADLGSQRSVLPVVAARQRHGPGGGGAARGRIWQIWPPAQRADRASRSPAALTSLTASIACRHRWTRRVSHQSVKSAGTLPPFSASLRMTALCTAMFISADPSFGPA